VGAVLSLVSLLLLAGYVLLDKKGWISQGKVMAVVEMMACIVFCVVFFAMVVLYFLVPFIYHFK
jgi:MFS superfamily sulfate permease-like transporter